MNWKDCTTLADITQYITQAQLGDPVAKTWREMLEDAAYWNVVFVLDDFIKVGYWRSAPMQEDAKRLQAAASVEGRFEELER